MASPQIDDQSTSLVAVTQAGRNDDSMMELTCRNHTGARYLTKRIFGRSLHFVRADAGYVEEVFRATKSRTEADHLIRDFTPDQISKMYNFGQYECRCPASDMIEVK